MQPHSRGPASILRLAVSAVSLVASTCLAQPVAETVFLDLAPGLLPNPVPAPTADLLAVPGYPNDPARLTLIGQLFRPDDQVHGDGPYPSVLVLHGSGGLWSNDVIANGMANPFDDWAEVLTDRGFLVLFVDSFNPRGIPGNFAGRRPSADPVEDDALCSPNYERPKDVLAALAYLDGLADADDANIALLGFSHGSQTGLNAILDPSVDLGQYTVRYKNEDDETEDLDVDPPVRIPDSLPFPRVCAFYYPGCGHYGYHGSSSSVAAGRYMPDRRTQVLMFHGTDDFLMDVDDLNVQPMTGDLYPIKFVESSALQAAAEGLPNPFVHHLLFHQAEHSFDNENIEAPGNWNTASESDDEKAKRLARDEVLKWFDYKLKPVDLRLVPDDLSPGDHLVRWTGRRNLSYELLGSETLVPPWSSIGGPVVGEDLELESPVLVPPSKRGFYKLRVGPLAPPTADPDNAGFFAGYDDFSY